MLVTLQEMKDYLSINDTPTTVQLTIDGTLRTLTRATGSWATAGVVVGSRIILSGFFTGSNNANILIDGVNSATEITFSAGQGLVDEVGLSTTAYGIDNTANDTFLTEQLNLIQEVIEGYCNRKFEEADYEQTFYRKDFEPEQRRRILAHHYPITAIASFVELNTTTSEEIAVEDYRSHNSSGTLIADVCPFFSNEDVMVLTYTAGYATIPYAIRSVVFNLVQERYNKKTSGIALNFGSDIQRISIPGTISVDFDYSLSSNERKSSYGAILGSQANIIDQYRSERTLGLGKITFVEESP